MLASVGGLVVNLSFSHAITKHLTVLDIQNPSVAALFNTPQILVRELDQNKLHQLADQLGLNAVELLDQARLYLINGIHHALWLAIGIAGIAIYISLKLPNIAHAQASVRDTLAETADDYL